MPAKVYGDESAAVQTHLSISQSVIQRMAANSAACKTWCITLVSAIQVAVADKGNPMFALIAFIPTLLFLGLDMYYLALERCFRHSYREFIDKLHLSTVETSDLCAVTPGGSLKKSFFNAFLSFSIWPFYVVLMIMIMVMLVIIK